MLGHEPHPSLQVSSLISLSYFKSLFMLTAHSEHTLPFSMLPETLPIFLGQEFSIRRYPESRRSVNLDGEKNTSLFSVTSS